MKNRNKYLTEILHRYSINHNSNNEIIINKNIFGANNIKLNSTEVETDSKVGIVIVPGMTVPRESYFKLLSHLSNHNVLLYDLRGQSYSKGEINSKNCIEDVNVVGQEFKKRRNLDYLVAVGHSFGGMNILMSSIENDHPYDLRISLAAPENLKKTAGFIPNIFSSQIAFLHNYIRTKQIPALNDDIVKHYQSFEWNSYKKNPRIVSLNIKNPKYFNQTRVETPKLSKIIKQIKKPSYLIYPGNDKRLKINSKNKNDYNKLTSLVNLYKLNFEIIDGLSHRFNKGIENEFILSYDNDNVVNRVKSIIKKEIKLYGELNI
jgi:pimeloyl-ACP methyl ester carboxylesterase